MIFYMGGVVEHSSNMPDPLALSSTEAEYKDACLDDQKSRKSILIFM
jgi:hypothetical protein